MLLLSRGLLLIVLLLLVFLVDSAIITSTVVIISTLGVLSYFLDVTSDAISFGTICEL